METYTKEIQESILLGMEIQLKKLNKRNEIYRDQGTNILALELDIHSLNRQINEGF